MGINTGVVPIDAEGITVEDGAEDTSGIHAVIFAGSDLDGTRIGEDKVGTRALPEGDGLSIDELGILIVEGVGLEEYVGGGAELRQHHDMLEVLRRESLHPTDVEQSAHTGQTVDLEGHLVCSVPDELRIKDRLGCGETLAVLRVEAVQQVYAPGIAGSGVGSSRVHVVERFAHHVVDGSHDEVVEGHCHALLDLIEKHRKESVELGGRGEGLIEGLLLHGTLDLERGHLVEELDVHIRLVEHVGIVGGAVREIPTLILRGCGKAGADLFEDGTVAPIVHEHGGSAAGVGAVDENNLADMVDEGTNEAVKRIGVEDFVASIDDALQVLSDEVILAESLDEGVVDDLINLFYFHWYFLLSV